MINKSTVIADFLQREIQLGHYRSGRAIPSRHRLAARFGCSRTTVERAVAGLIRAGVLHCRRGSGTYVAEPGAHSGFRRLYVIAGYDVRHPETAGMQLLFSPEIIGSGFEWIDLHRAAASFETLAEPGSAVIWVMPGLEQLAVMDALQARGIPQLLLNRRYRNFDCVCTDADAGIREGLAWLLIEAGRDIAFLSHAPGTERPYLAERIIAFYAAASESGVRLAPERVRIGDWPDIPRDLARLAFDWFNAPERPRGLFVMSQELALPLVMAAQHHGLEPGRDYRLLMFDAVPELAQTPGVAMMRQPFHRYGAPIRRWLELQKEGADATPFTVGLKTELIFSNPQPNGSRTARSL